MAKKKNSKKVRFRGVQVFILLLVIVTQIIAHRLGRNQRGDYKDIISSINAVHDSGQILYFYNRARIAFQEAQMFFNFYLVEKDETFLQHYKESVQSIEPNLDSLDQVTVIRSGLRGLMEERGDCELQVAYLKSSLDSLLLPKIFENNSLDTKGSSVSTLNSQGNANGIIEAYSKFRLMDQELEIINQKILSLDNQILAEYNMLYSQIQLKYKENLDANLNAYRLKQEKLNGFLFAVFLLAGFALIMFLFRNFKYEKDLEKANKVIGDNLLAKNKLISLISHDIQTPLNLISIYSGQLKKKFKDIDKMEKFGLLQYTANNTLLFSSQILELAATENAEVVLKESNSNLKETLTPILKTLDTLTEDNGNILDAENILPENIMVKIDHSKLFRLFYNLVGNANSYTRNGIIKVRFDLSERDTGYLLKSTIEDTGIGIEEKFLDKLFDPYSQVEREGQYNHFGVGLGLYLCKGIVNLYNGKINIKSKVGQGTTVFFELQLEKASELNH